MCIDKLVDGAGAASTPGSAAAGARAARFMFAQRPELARSLGMSPLGVAQIRAKWSENAAVRDETEALAGMFDLVFAGVIPITRAAGTPTPRG